MLQGEEVGATAEAEASIVDSCYDGCGASGSGGYGAGSGASGANANAYAAAGGAGIAAGGAGALPFMQGDVGFTCGEVTFGGLGATLGHPNFGCSHLNLAENGSPMPQDRIFFGYRHWENPVETDVFSSPGVDNSATLNVDRYTFGFEKTFLRGLMSLELRVPFNSQLTNNMYIEDVHGDSGGTIPVTSTEFNLGDVAFAFKGILLQRRCWAITGGLGVKLPTAPDVTIEAHVDDDGFDIGNDEVDAYLDIRAMVANETVCLSPFIGYTCRPTNRFFSQGFLQIEIPLNETQAVMGIEGTFTDVTDVTNSFPISGVLGPHDGAELTWQTLMRLNMQFGYWLYQNPCARHVDAIAAIFEVHYTTTLEDAETLGPHTLINGWQIDGVTPGGSHSDVTVEVGNLANRVDIVNLGFATPVKMGCTEITPGVTVPLSTGDNKPFDWEFALMVNRRF